MVAAKASALAATRATARMILAVEVAIIARITALERATDVAKAAALAARVTARATSAPRAISSRAKATKVLAKDHLSTNLVSVLLLVKSMAETTPTIHQQIDKLRLKLVRTESEIIESLDLVAD